MFREQYQEMTFENNQEIMDMTAWCAYEMGMGPYYLYRQKNMAGNLRMWDMQRLTKLEFTIYLLWKRSSRSSRWEQVARRNWCLTMEEELREWKM